ncbi:hypothetical protein [Idiomarina loihiensis]|uniref:helix-turn-helix transcriptional regulator n=1 Tax=Idiomarina loihiensis TaxID=135577 RepID=UPI0031583E6A
MKGFVRLNGVCDLLSISRQTLRNLREKGLIDPPIRIKGTAILGWKLEYLEEWIDSQPKCLEIEKKEERL